MFSKREMPSIKGEMKNQEEVETVRAELKRLYASKSMHDRDRIRQLQTHLDELKPHDYTPLEQLLHQRTLVEIEQEMLDPQIIGRAEYDDEVKRIGRRIARIDADISEIEMDEAGRG